MMLSRNPGHRVLGSRVAVPSGDFYAAATVQAMRIDTTGNELVTVKFDDNNKGECPSSEVVGNGFKSIHDIKLHRNQKVYTTHNGHEVMGSVEEHRDGCVRVNLLSSNESINKREEDVRLIESRYSPRLQDHIYDPDYRRFASVNASPSHGKRRPVSNSIEVPKGRLRKWSNEPTMDELMAAMVLSNLSNSPHFRQPKSPTIRKGSSPHSLGSSGVGSWGQDAQISPVKGESMSQPVGASAPQNMSTPPERTQSVIHHTHSIEHSPSSIADPIEVDTSTDMDTSVPMDESIDYKSSGGVVPPGHSTPAPFQTGSPGVQFQPIQASSPPQNPAFLAKQSLKLESVKEEPNGREEEKHRVDIGYALPRFYYIPPLMPSIASTRPDFMVHLQPSATPPPPVADEHQYRELTQSPRHHQDFGIATSSNAPVYVGSPQPAIYIPVLGSSPLNSNLAFGSSAPPVASPLGAATQMDMRSTPPRQTVKLSDNSHRTSMPVRNKQAQPINIPGIRAFSWHSTGVPESFPPKHSLVMQRQHMHRASSPKSPFSMSPKVPTPGRKIRGDGRKCRKIYGMENRDMWCTACRWKKACQRFPD